VRGKAIFVCVPLAIFWNHVVIPCQRAEQKPTINPVEPEVIKPKRVITREGCTEYITVFIKALFAGSKWILVPDSS
jgi:hypothetical protein